MYLPEPLPRKVALEPTGVEIPANIPTHWYNLKADLPVAYPEPLHPQTKEPLQPEDLAPLFSQELIRQEFTKERYIEIPQTVREIYASYRPSPLRRAVRLERALGTKAEIYYKFEGNNPIGSHKANSAIPQAYYNAQEGIERLTTETGAGQWGSALSMAAAMFGLQANVWQVRTTYENKPYRRLLMESYGGTCVSSPSELTEVGRKILREDPDTTGSLGMAIAEAVEAAVEDPKTHYTLGSVLCHVTLHQSIIGLEVLDQMQELAGATPDVIFGCAGGGSNLGGLAFPAIGKVITEGAKIRVIAAEPAACPSITKGEYRYDYGDVTGMTPLLKMHTLGNEFVPDPIHAGGLRYHGMAPLVSHAVELGYIDAVAVEQSDTFAAGLYFARNEGILPAPESTHAIAAALDYAQKAEAGEKILIGISGTGQLDLASYHQFL